MNEPNITDSGCRFRHPFQFDANAVVHCLHHRVVVKDRVVSPELCSQCDKQCGFAPALTKHIPWPSLAAGGDPLPSPQRNCLIVLQPREIPECLRSIENLPLDMVFFRAFSEYQLVVPLNQFIQRTNYDNYLLVADDVIVNRKAYEVVASLLEQHELATGYCRLSQDSSYVNLTRSPLRLSDGRIPVMADYDFYHLDEIKQFQQATFLSWFGGWALTGMRRKIWLEFPFRVNRYSACQSDFESSWLINRPFVTHQSAYIEHLKPHVMGICDTNLLVGHDAPRIITRDYRNV